MAAGRVCVVGAGPAGLVACKTLKEQGFEPVVFEAGTQVGGTFRTKSYDDGRLVSSKFITAFSDLRMGEEAEDHPLIEDYLAYLEAYCDKFSLWPHIRFSQRVASVARVEDGGRIRDWSYRVTVEPASQAGTAPAGGEQSDEIFDAVCVCSGLHNEPYEPELPGKFDGEVVHSSLYKNKEAFRDKRVLVVGAGETGLDLVYRAIQVTKSVFLSTRSGFLSVPYVIGNGLPLDTFITNLFECSHMHPLLERFKIKWKFTTPFIRLGFLLGTGSSCGYNQWAGCKDSSLVQRGYLIINKSTNALPWINRAAKKRSFLGRWLYSRLDDTPLARELNDREIVVKRGIERVDGKTVLFQDGVKADFDLIVLATGYAVRFPFLADVAKGPQGLKARVAPAHSAAEIIDDQGKRQPAQDQLPVEHNICNPDEVTLAFIGFVRPNVGSIPPMAELQVFWWIQRLRGAIPGPRATPSYHLLAPNARTGAYGVDYGAYMHDLARDIGADPRVGEMLWRSPRAMVAWALGQAYIPFFRLRGPFAQAEAWDMAATELYSPVARRPLASNVLFVSLIGLFLVANAAAIMVHPFASLFL